MSRGGKHTWPISSAGLLRSDGGAILPELAGREFEEQAMELDGSRAAVGAYENHSEQLWLQ